MFCLWYTNTKGALSDTEIAGFVQRVEGAGSPADRVERLRRFMTQDNGDQFLMVNLLHMAEDPDAGANMDRYMAHMPPRCCAGQAIRRLSAIPCITRWT